MTTYEYCTVLAYWSDPKELDELGQMGWECYNVVLKPDSQVTYLHFMRRRSDTYCEHCAKAKLTMAGLETIVP